MSNFRLPINHHGTAAGQSLHVDPDMPARKRQRKAFVDDAFSVHSFVHLGLAQKVNGALFKDTGSNSAFNVLPALPLQNDRIDTVKMEQLRQQ